MLRDERSDYGGLFRRGGACTAVASVVAGTVGLFVIPASFLSGLQLVMSASLFLLGTAVFSVGLAMLLRKRATRRS